MEAWREEAIFTPDIPTVFPNPSPNPNPQNWSYGLVYQDLRHELIIVKYISHPWSDLNKIWDRSKLEKLRSMGGAGFFLICTLHSLIALSCGASMMFYSNEIYVFSHGHETAIKLQGSTMHDRLLIETSDSFSGLLLFAIGFVLFMVSFVKDREFQSFFAKGCVLLHLSMASWRVYFGRRVEDLAHVWPRQVVGDVALAFSWVFFLVYSWREKYD